MAGIASISGSVNPHVAGSAVTPPPVAGIAPDGSGATGAGNFTAFPASYAGFGNADTGFGTVGIRDGAISVIPFSATAAVGGVVPAAIPVRPPTTPAAASEDHAVGDTAVANPATAAAPVTKSTVNPDVAPGAVGSTASTSSKVPGGYTIFASPGSAASAAGPAGGPLADAVPGRSPIDTPTASDAQAGDDSGKNAPNAGLLGAPAGGGTPGDPAAATSGAPVPPGGKDSGPPPGLLGSAPSAPAPPATPGPVSGLQPPDLYQPPTGSPNSTASGPPVLGSAQQQQQAEQATQQLEGEQRADAAAADTQIAIADLERTNLRLSAAYDQGNGAAVKQLEPVAVTTYNAQLQGSIWANLGTVPPQPFAAPEIPPAFLNVAS